MTPQNASVSVRRKLAADPARVFAAFSDAGALAQWFSPAPQVAVQVLTFDFTLGGTFRLAYAMPDGSTETVGGVFRRIQPPHNLEFTWVWEPPDQHAGLETVVSVEIAETSDGCEVIITHSQLPNLAAQGRYHDGWSGTLQQLHGWLTAQQTAPSP